MEARPGHFRERIEELGLTGGKAASTSGTKDTAKNLADAEDEPRNVESKAFQWWTSIKMIFHCLDDSTIHFEMVMVISDMQTDGRNNGKDAGDA